MSRLIALLFLLATTLPASAQSPSFDCRRASVPAEHAICANPMLAALDLQLAAAYANRRAALGPAGRQYLLDEQRAWIGARNGCFGDVGCLAATMQARIAALTGVAVAPVSGPPSLAVGLAGRYQPVSDPVLAAGFMDLRDGQITLGSGGVLTIRPVRAGSRVVQVLTTSDQSGSFQCGPNFANYLVFHEAGNDGTIAVHSVLSTAPPAEPVGSPYDISIPGRCSMMFYAR